MKTNGNGALPHAMFDRAVANMLSRLGRQSKVFLWLLSLALLALCGWVDYATGSELSVEIIYLVPLALATMLLGQWQGYLFAFLGAAAWFLADFSSSASYSHPVIPYWNALVRFGGFVIVCYAFGSVRNVARFRHEQQEKAHQIQQLECLRKLAGGLAHDFNNMLQVVIGQGEMALASPTMDNAGRTMLEAIIRSAQRMADLARQMQIYSGGFLALPQTLDLSRLADEMRPTLNECLPDTVQVVYDLAPGLPPIKGDRALLRQIVRNLVINAREAMNALHGVITIRTAVTVLQEEDMPQAVPGCCALAPGSYVTLEVGDTGHGIDAATREHIFDPFFSTKFIGRGLGLSVVMGIVRELHGAIFVISAPKKGTIFRIAWPLAKESASATSPAEPMSVTTIPPGSPATILVVDDEPGLLEISRRILTMAGFQVRTAINGEEGVDAFRSEAATMSLVLMDLMMPKMDGLEAFRRIRQIRPDVPVIIISGYGKEDVCQRFGAHQPSGVLQKPYANTELFALLRKFVQMPSMPGSGISYWSEPRPKNGSPPLNDKSL